MRKLKLIMLMTVFCTFMPAYAQKHQEAMRVYAEILGTGTNFLGLNKNVKVTVDMGQPQSSFSLANVQGC